jgi:hypothetical protein
MSRSDAGGEGFWIFEGGLCPGNLKDIPLTRFFFALVPRLCRFSVEEGKYYNRRLRI